MSNCRRRASLTISAIQPLCRIVLAPPSLREGLFNCNPATSWSTSQSMAGLPVRARPRSRDRWSCPCNDLQSANDWIPADSYTRFVANRRSLQKALSVLPSRALRVANFRVPVCCATATQGKFTTAELATQEKPCERRNRINLLHTASACQSRSATFWPPASFHIPRRPIASAIQWLATHCYCHK